MNLKKIAAALAAAAMLGASLTLTPAAVGNVPAYVADQDEYDSMSETQKNNYTKTTVSGYAYFMPETDEQEYYESGTYYVRNEQSIYIAAFTESYVGHDILANGKKLDVSESDDGISFGSTYYLTSDSKELNISMKARKLTAEEKADFIKINADPGIIINKNTNPDHPDYIASGDLLLRIDNGDYAHKGAFYYIYALSGEFDGKDICVNGSKLDVNPNYNGKYYGAFYQVKDTDKELTLKLGSDPANVISEIKRSNKKEVTVNAPYNGITAGILSELKSSKKVENLTVKYSSSLKVEISKKDITGKPVDLDLTKGSNFLSSKKISDIKQLKNSSKTIQMNFDNGSDFGGVDKVKITSYIGTGLKNKTAVVYEYKDGKLTKTASEKISAAGSISFDITHYGQYIIAAE